MAKQDHRTATEASIAMAAHHLRLANDHARRGDAPSCRKSLQAALREILDALDAVPSA